MRLGKPTRSERNWDIPLNTNLDVLDAVTAIGSLTVTALELPSQSLQVRVTGGSYLRSDSTIASFAGVSSLTILANSQIMLWLTDSGALVTGLQFPATFHLRLASVTTNLTTIASISDQRIQCAVAGQANGTALSSVDIASGSFKITSPSTHQSFLSVNVNDGTIGFFGVIPKSQTPTVAPLQNRTLALSTDLIQDVGLTFSQDQLNVNFSSMTSKINFLVAALKHHGLMAN